MTKPTGGRPKAADVWGKVTVLPGKKQVRCNYCGLVFAKNATRIKSHINQIPRRGIQTCDRKEKGQLPNSQEAAKRIMTKPAGGRPKAAEVWEHVTILVPGKKKVRCKYCPHVFAASPKRIKCHIYQIPGQGIRICPNAKNMISDPKEKDQFPGSQDAEKGMIRKPRGRPKARNTWEHVRVLEGKKQVECKHCGSVFAANANRIKSHINQIKGMGIRPCPKYKIIMRDTKEKVDLLDSQVIMVEEPSNKSIQLCPNPEDSIVDPKEKVDLLDSQVIMAEEPSNKSIQLCPNPEDSIVDPKEKEDLLDSQVIVAEEPSNKGIQLCPNPENTIGDLNEKEDLLDSQSNEFIEDHAPNVQDYRGYYGLVGFQSMTMAEVMMLPNAP